MCDAIALGASVRHLGELGPNIPEEPLPQRWGARNPDEMAQAVTGDGILNGDGQGVPNQNYASVLAYASAQTTPINLAAVSIFAWGGMRRSNAHLAFGASTDWLDTCCDIRKGKLTRVEAYGAFLELRPKEGGRSRLPGVGPAFWTKLIHFLMPRDDGGAPGYILDQWAGASINMIFERDVVKMDRYAARVWKRRVQAPVQGYSAMVSELTSAEQYEDFCLHLESIAAYFECAPQAVDCAFMSNEEGGWRDYLKLNYLAGHD